MRIAKKCLLILLMVLFVLVLIFFYLTHGRPKVTVEYIAKHIKTTQEPRLNHPEKIPVNVSGSYKDWYDWGILSSASEIVKMHPIRIYFVRLIIDNLPKTENKENIREFFNDVNNFEINVEITDANNINAIMSALSKPPIEEGPWWISYEKWIIFTDENSQIKRTVISTHPDKIKGIFLYDKFYGEETYNVIEDFLKKEKNEHYRKLKARHKL